MTEEAPIHRAPERTRDRVEFPYVRNMMGVCALLSLLPPLFGILTTQQGFRFLGHPFAFDDHMVYAAWMRQAMEGRILMDNRFAIDPQPGITIHLYFLVVGWFAKVVGLFWAATLAKVGFVAVFVWLAYGLIRRVTRDVFAIKIALALVCFGAGFGFLVWHNFGRALVNPMPEFLRGWMGGMQPTDVWQPEGFVFPSMLTNGLFMASLSLILIAFSAFLDARDDWNAVWKGGLAMLVLMNVHAYDALLVALVMMGFLGAALVSRTLTLPWLGRAVLIGCGAIPTALYFLHVLSADPVFRKRAETETYTSNFLQVFWGYLPLLALGLWGAWSALPASSPVRRRLGVGLMALMPVGMLIGARGHTEGFWMTLPSWLGLFAFAVAIVALNADESPARNLILAWAIVGVVAPYFPGLFQRKLLMGLSIPWAILAALGLAHLMHRLKDRGTRNLVTVLSIVIVSATSFRWLVRQFDLIRREVASTTVHSPYVSSDAVRILEYLDAQPGRKVVLAIPGVPSPDENSKDSFSTPYLPDLNPVVSGLTGSYTYAGHWSETPDYLRRRDLALRFFLPQTSDETRRAILAETQADFVVVPVPEAYPQIADVTHLGTVVVEGTQWRLIKVR
ncbi:MAG: hypothetical protein KIS66_01900 [Fimbriimonadaceae bacterium]|nr:hypothetical protein [Fimbriimonadaceae bacterium]